LSKDFGQGQGLARELGLVGQEGMIDIKFEPGDGSERCCICGVRSPVASLYVMFPGERLFDGEQLKYPVCSLKHGREYMAWLLSHRQRRLLP